MERKAITGITLTLLLTGLLTMAFSVSQISASLPQTNTWTNMNPSVRPPARIEHAMAYDSESGMVVLFGGGGMVPVFDDTWVYNYITNTWTNMNPSVKPAARNEHPMAYDSESDRVILFGGWGLPYWGDTWAYDYNTNTWTNMNPSVRPSARADTAMAYDSESDRVILFGGAIPYLPYLHETWAYDYNTNTWTNMNPSVKPPGRTEHSMAYDSESDKVILFGGWTDGIYLDDTWAYDFNTNTWINMNPSVKPPARLYTAMAYDLQSDGVILFGGITGSGYLDDTWAYDYNTNTWTNMNPSVKPPARWAHSLAYDSQSDRVILFGGWNGSGYFDDTWAYYLDVAAPIQATIDIDPDTLNLKSKGEWITCYIELTEGYNVSDIDVSTILLNDTVPAEWSDIQDNVLMVKFNRNEVICLLDVGNQTIKITGQLTDGTPFEGTDMIRAIHAQITLADLHTIHLNVTGAFLQGENLKVKFYSYSDAYQGETTVWSGTTPAQIHLSMDLAQNSPIENAIFILTDNEKNTILNLLDFVVHRSDLFGRITQMDTEWTYASPEERTAIFKEILDIDMQWAYAPP